MKSKYVKAIFCIIIIALSILHLVAKYDTYGVTPGPIVPKGETCTSYIWKTSGKRVQHEDILQFKNGVYYFYLNQFGRVVILEKTAKYRNDFSQSIRNQYGDVILNVWTIPNTGIPTHLDFLGVANGRTTIHSLIERAGFPNELYNIYGFRYRTVDGYWYDVVVDFDSSTIESIQIWLPNGDNMKVMTSDEARAFQKQVLVYYLGIAAVLSVVLVLLIKIPNAIRKRKGIASAE